MNRLISLFFIFFIFLTGCSKSTQKFAWENSGKIKVLSTTAMIDDLVSAIGGDRIEHMPLIVGEMDPHAYELVKGDDEKITDASFVIGNGLNLEHGASLRYLLEKHNHVLYLGNEIQKSKPEKIIVWNGQIDPHVWMDISLWAEGIEPIVLALSQLDPEGENYYKANGRALHDSMLKTHKEIQTEMKSVPSEKRYLVTSHDAFHYFARAYLGDDLSEDRCVAPEGLAPEGQLSTQDIKRVTKHLCKHQIRVVFPESNVPRDALWKIASSCKAKGLDVHISSAHLYSDAMGEKNSAAGTYLGMMLENARTLKVEWER